MGYFQVRYDSRVVNYDHRVFIRLATGEIIILVLLHLCLSNTMDCKMLKRNIEKGAAGRFKLFV